MSGNYDGLVDVFSGTFFRILSAPVVLRTSKIEHGGDGGNAPSGNAFAAGHGAAAYSGPGGNASGGSVTHGRHGKFGRRSIQSLLWTQRPVTDTDTTF